MSRLRFMFLSVLADAVFVNVAIVASFLIRFWGHLPAYNFRAYLTLAPLLTLGYLFAGWLYGLYEPEHMDSPWSVTASAASATTLGTLILTALAFFGGSITVAFSRFTIPFSWLFAVVLMVGWRLLFLRFGAIHWPEQRTIIIGCNQTALDLARALDERRKWGWNFIGYVAGPDDTVTFDAAPDGAASTQAPPDPPATAPEPSAASAVGDAHHPLLGVDTQLPGIIDTHAINRILIAEPAHLREFIEHLVLADHPRLTVDVVPELYETFIGHTDSILGDIPLMRIVSSFTPRYHRALKRLIDIAGALIILIVTSPFMLLLTPVLLLTQGLPILYSQERVGYRQKVFKIYKLRTMHRDAEQQTGPVLAAENDPRITPVGRFLRRARWDELPQVLNILRGDMSFIGPRPERPHFVHEFLRDIPGYAERFRIKPGVTGLAQINGGYATTPQRKLKYDLMYLYHQSLVMDLQIVVETIKVVMTGRGAR
ncbi:MAG: sugar transferase [Actinomycetes bacterium]|jgi:lipopolysaccharide/colanic/teichoic acid biosynthesis glycosyltransferase|nr:sugar transferase [Actinomycetes bacterium]